MRDFPDGGVSWRDLWVIVTQAQPESAVFRATNPQWQASIDAEMLRSIEFSLRALRFSFARANGARSLGTPPEPWLWPWERDDEPDRMTLDQLAELFADDPEWVARFRQIADQM